MSVPDKSHAVVLRSMDYRGTSKIVTLYTRERGKVSVIVKGARERRSRYGSTLEPMSHIAVVAQWKEGRDLQLLTEASHVTLFRTLGARLETMAVGLAIVELVNAVTHYQEANPELFDLLVASLVVLDSREEDPIPVLCYFELRLAKILGFSPAFDRCLACGEEIAGGGESPLYADAAKGGLLCSKCGSRTGDLPRLSQPAADLLQTIFALSLEDLLRLPKQPPSALNEAKSFLWSYLRFHVPGLKALKSERVFSNLFDPV